MHLAKLLLCMLVLALTQTYAQEPATPYIQDFGERFSLHPFIRTNTTALEVLEKQGGLRHLYLANTPVSIGCGFWWRSLGFSLSVGIPHTRRRDALPSKFFDFQYHFYGKYIIIDLYAFSYKGLYGRNRVDRLVQSYNDSHISRIGLRAAYPILGQHFSYAAAYEQTKKQNHPAYCLPVGVGLYYQNVQSTFPRIEVVRSNNYLVELYGGIAIVLPWRKHFFVALETTLGMTQSLTHEAFTNFQPSYSLATRSSLGYSRQRWSLALVLYYHTLGFGQSQTQHYSVSTAMAEIAYTYRIFRFFEPLKWLEIGNKFLDK